MNNHQSEVRENMDRFDPREQSDKQQQAQQDRRTRDIMTGDDVTNGPGPNIGNRPGPCEPREG